MRIAGIYSYRFAIALGGFLGLPCEGYTQEIKIPSEGTTASEQNAETEASSLLIDAAEQLPKASVFENMEKRLSAPPSLFPFLNASDGWLRRHGTIAQLDNLNEFMGAVTSPTKGHGYRQGASNAGQYAFNVFTDWSSLVGLKGFTTHAIFIGRYGTTANRMFGDWLAHSQETYGGGGNVVVHMVMAYGEQHLFNNRLAIAAGRMAQLSDFASGTMFCTFINNSFCGRPKGAGDSSYYSSYPASVWALRVRGRPWRRDIYIQTGIYFAEEGIYSTAQHRTGFKLNGSNIVGEIFPTEVGWQPTFWRKSHRYKYSGHYKLGVAVETMARQENFYNSLGNLYEDSGYTAARHSGAWSIWLMGDQCVKGSAYNPNGGVFLLGGAVFNDRKTALRDRQLYIGLVWKGFWKQRPADSIGLGLSYVHIAPGVQRTERMLYQAKRSLPYRATGIQSHQEVAELNYTLSVTGAITFEPDIQYYHNPNGQVNLKDAWMLGFRSHVEIF
ncbi:carbohydrate porin [Swingsia samuiensis]|uniref:Carbohydrate porin n=1 Tax=Swingsia samuiensis TaxID=1293412 RepID=A0A4Y6UGL3_9PROT|nr:carbohydrate porin [Swingsia samuiensis]QDH16712.1 carbohydrate porin [Swingsia samuiensis]